MDIHTGEYKKEIYIYIYIHRYISYVLCICANKCIYVHVYRVM